MQPLLSAVALFSALTLHFWLSAAAPTAATSDFAATAGSISPRGDGEGYAHGAGAPGGQDIVENAPNDSSTTSPINTVQILCASTGKFVAITRSGRVSGNNPIGPLVTHFYSHYITENGKTLVTLKSVKYSHRNWYLTVTSRRRFRGDVPMVDNERFEILTVGGYSVLKVVSPPRMNHTQSQNVSSSGPVAGGDNSTLGNSTLGNSTLGNSTLGNSTLTSSSPSGFGFGSGSGMESENGNGTTIQPVVVTQTPDCYLGFSAAGKPACYESYENVVQVRLQFLVATINN